MSTLCALLVQPQLRWQDAAENRRVLEDLIGGAGDGADLIVVPETFSTGFLGDTKQEAESMDGPTVAWMKSLAARYGAALAGSVVIGEGGRRYNRFLFVTPEGEVGRYDKRHLFAFGGENRRYTAGRERVVLDYRGWRICPQVCFDLRFPVWCRNRNDYELLLFVANWPVRRVEAWKALLRARAIENQAYVIGVNRVGKDGNGLEYSGDSMAFDPMGAELAHLGNEVATRRVTLDLEEVGRVRRELPFLADADSFRLEP